MMKKIIFILFCLFIGMSCPTRAQFLFDVRIDKTSKAGQRFLVATLKNMSEVGTYKLMGNHSLPETSRILVLELTNKPSKKCYLEKYVVLGEWRFFKPQESDTVQVELPADTPDCFEIIFKQFYIEYLLPHGIDPNTLNSEELSKYSMSKRVFIRYDETVK